MSVLPVVRLPDEVTFIGTCARNSSSFRLCPATEAATTQSYNGPVVPTTPTVTVIAMSFFAAVVVQVMALSEVVAVRGVNVRVVGGTSICALPGNEKSSAWLGSVELAAAAAGSATLVVFTVRSTGVRVAAVAGTIVVALIVTDEPPLWYAERSQE